MKKNLIVGVLYLFTAFSCDNAEKKQARLIDSLSSTNVTIKNELTNKDELLSEKEVALTEFVNSFNEIQENLKEIKTKEKIISSATEQKDLKKGNKDEIIKDIQLIYDLLDKNKQKVAGLNNKLKQSNLKISEVELAVSNLTSQLASKESEIAELKGKLESLNLDFADLKVRYSEEQQESDLKTVKLNTAYYVVSSKKELAEKGIITKKGGFVGIRKVIEMNPSVDDNYFTQVNIALTKEIPIHGDKVKLISPHPADSYQLVEGKGSIDKIVILDSEKFWRVSKYLIIASETK